jgi:hypothetical protein
MVSDFEKMPAPVLFAVTFFVNNRRDKSQATSEQPHANAARMQDALQGRNEMPASLFDG